VIREEKEETVSDPIHPAVNTPVFISGGFLRAQELGARMPSHIGGFHEVDRYA
jgi:hypothetical protein